jgi:D-mannonate dehydratase
MKLQIENSISRIADEARGRYFELLKGARQQTESAAGRVIKGKGPVKTVSKLGLKISAVSHRTADKVLKQQTRMVEHQIDAIAARLHAAATAADIRDLVGTQFRLIPVNISRFADDARTTLSIVTSAGQEVGKLVKGTVADFRGKTQPKKTAKKVAKKASKKKAAAKKAPAKKAKAKVEVVATKPAEAAGEQKAA